MVRLVLALIFLIPFQGRFYKFFRHMSSSWMDPGWHFTHAFESFGDLYISDVILIVLCLWAIFQKKFSFRTLWEGDNKYLTAYVGAAFLSIVVCDYSSYPVHYWRWAHLALSAGVVYLLRAWALPFRTIATVVVLSAVLECAVALPQYFMQHQIGLKVLGERTLVSKHAAPAQFTMPKRAVTSIDYLLSQSQETTRVIRASGTLPHPNMLGAFLVFSLMMTCYLYEQSAKRGWIGAALFLQIVTLFTTYCRAAIFAFAGAILVWMVLSWLKEKRMCKACRPLVMGFAVSVLLFYPQLFHRGGVVSYNELASKSDVMRISMQKVALLMIQDHPWMGIGYNNYLLALPHYTKGAVVDTIMVHNIYLLIAAEMGLIGLAVFLVFCGVVLYRGWQQRGTLEGRTLLLLFLAFLAIGFVDYHPIFQQQIRLAFFLTGGLLFTMSPVIMDNIKSARVLT
jgi:O-antigen ligase